MVDILKPELVWIEGRCYRVNDPSTEVSALQEYDLYENDMNYNDELVGEDDEDFEVTMVDNTRYETSFHVSKHYVGGIIGKKGATKMRIERETKTNIKIPKHNESGDIVIFGPMASNVKMARRRINMIVISSRNKQRPTHFVSIPFNMPEIMSSFETFKNEILRDNTSKGIEESIFIRKERLHLTIGVTCLMDNEERIAASKLLAEAKEKIIMPLLRSHSPLRIRIKGLSYMNDDPKDIHVLYANVQEEEDNDQGVLQKLADQVFAYFDKAGFMQNRYNNEHVKLHMTLLNSSYRAESGDARRGRQSFDGSQILQNYADFDFGVTELTEIHLSLMGTSVEDGYYQPSCVISCRLPQ